jgi:carbamoyltransferase
MYILGINAYHADSSAAILVDGKLVAATEEERFTRVKHWAGFPAQAIQFCLREAGITLDQVDHIAIGRDPKAKFNKKMMYLLKHPSGGFDMVKRRFDNSRKVASLETEFAKLSGLPESVIKPKIHNIEHHRSHLASAFFVSPFEEAALLSIDGSGDFTTTMIGIGRGNKIEVLDSVDFPMSVGSFYTSFTQFLGFPHYGDEYKVMGLAPYGNPQYVDKLRDVIRFTDNGLFEWNEKYFKSAKDVVVSYENNIPFVDTLYTPYLEEKFGPSRKKNEELTQYHKDIAASVQRFTEELILHIVNHLQKRTGLKNVCIAGGVAQNSVANGKIIKSSNFDNLYIPSAGHDAGISMGCAYYVYNQVLGMPRPEPVYSAYTGSKFSNEEIEAYLKSRNITYTRYSDEQR